MGLLGVRTTQRAQYRRSPPESRVSELPSQERMVSSQASGGDKRLLPLGPSRGGPHRSGCQGQRPPSVQSMRRARLGSASYADCSPTRRSVSCIAQVSVCEERTRAAARGHLRTSPPRDGECNEWRALRFFSSLFLKRMTATQRLRHGTHHTRRSTALR